jgi:hypothetical protein
MEAETYPEDWSETDIAAKEASTPSWKRENHEHHGAVSTEEITELKELYNTRRIQRGHKEPDES